MSTKNSTIIRCLWCRTTVSVGTGTSSALCGRCVAKLSDAPAPVRPAPAPLAAGEAPRGRGRPRKNPLVEKVATGRGRGWHLKKIVKYDDVFFSYGQPVTESEAKTLGYVDEISHITVVDDA